MVGMLRLRFWFEVALGSGGALLTLLTLAWPDWIEAVLGVDPDHYSGAAEWVAAAACLAVAAACWFAATVEWRRAPAGVLLAEESHHSRAQ